MNPPHPSLAHLLDLLLDAVCIVDAGGTFVFVSAASQRIFGYAPDEMIGKPMIDFVLPEDRLLTLGAVDEIISGAAKPHFENRYVRKDGAVVHIMWSARWSEPDRVRVAVARDVTERKRAEAKQAALYEIAEATLSAADVAALFARVHRAVAGLLPAVHMTVSLIDAADALVCVYGDPAPPLAADAAACMAAAFRTGASAADGNCTPPMLAVPLRSERGMLGALLVYGQPDALPYTETDGELLQFVATQLAAAVERKQLDAQLRKLAERDTLTDLPNRFLLQQRLDAALHAARGGVRQLAVLYLDLDRFKQVNDSLGHGVGDLLLQGVGDRLRLCIRGSDTVARIGGDEFAVLLSGIHQAEFALAVAEKIRDCMARPFAVGGHTVEVSASIGVAVFPHDGSDETQLIRAADDAMYRAKHSGGNRIQWNETTLIGSGAARPSTFVAQ